MFVILWLVSIVATALLAGRYQRSVLGWSVLSIFIGFLATILVLAMGPATAPYASATVHSPDHPHTHDPGLAPDRQPCPRCAESIATRARVCRFCGFELAAG